MNKVIGINGSPRINGNTSKAINIIFRELENEGIQTELIQIGGKSISPCRACMKCRIKKDGYCHMYKNNKDDILNNCLKKIYEAQGLIIGSPVYFGSVTPEIKAFIDRAGYCSRGSDKSFLRRKVCIPVTVLRRQGALVALETITNLFALSEAIVPYSNYWNMALNVSGKDDEDIMHDKEGIGIFKTLGKNMAWLINKLYS